MKSTYLSPMPGYLIDTAPVTFVHPDPLPPSIVAIVAKRLDLLTRSRLLDAEAGRLGVVLLYETDASSPNYGQPIGCSPRGR